MTRTLSEEPHEIERQVWRARRARRWRRVGTVLLALIVVGALSGLYGPREVTRSTESSWGVLEVTTPRVVRAGVDLSVRITLRPERSGQPYVVAVDLAWVEDLGVETVTPAPTSESSTGEAWLLTYDENPGETVVLTGRVPTHPRIGPVHGAIAVGPAGQPPRDGVLDLTTWVMP